MLRPLQPGERIDRFEVRALLGRGGMGAVYLALDTAAGRQVALKLVPCGDARWRERFQREGQAAAALDHPHVVRVHAAGEVRDMGWISQEYLPGGSLQGLLERRGRLSWREAATLGVGVARGLAAIHAAGLVHRDLKPANVLLDADDSPKIADLGLVRVEGAGQGLTKTGELLGTLEYMAPEGLRDPRVDARADLYSLGGLLHALMIGEPPFTGTAHEIAGQLIGSRPRSLRDRVPDLPRDLDRLVLRLLEHDPARRGSAAGVAEELQALLEGRRRQVGWRVGPSAALVAVAGVALGGALGLFAPADEPAGKATATAPVPSSVAPVPSSAPVVASSTSGLLRVRRSFGRSWRAGGEVYAVGWLDAGRAVLGDGSGWVRVVRVPSGEQEACFRTGSREVRALAIRDGVIATSLSDPPAVVLWQADGRELARVALSPGYTPMRLAFAPDGRLAVIESFGDGSHPGQVSIYATQPRLSRLTRVGSPDAHPRAVAWLPGGRLLIADAMHGAGLRVWDATFTQHTLLTNEALGGIAVSNDGASVLVAVAEEDGGQVALRELVSGRELVRLEAPEPSLSSLLLTPDGRRAVTGSGFASPANLAVLKAWDLATGKRLWPAADAGLQHLWHVWDVALSPDGRVVVSGSGDGYGLWDLESGRDLRERADVQQGWMNALELLPDGRVLTAADDATVFVRDPESGQRRELRAAPPLPPTRLLCAALSPDGSQLLTGLQDGTSLLDLGSGEVVQRTPSELQVRAVVWTDQRRLVLRENQVEDLDGAGVLLRGRDSWITQLVLLPGEERLAVAHAGGIELLTLGPPARVTRSIRCGAIQRAAAARDGRSLLVGDASGGLGWVDLTDEAPLRAREAHPDGVLALAISPAGDLAVSSGRDGLRLWRLPELEPLDALDVAGDLALQLRFAPDGRTLHVATHRGLLLVVEVGR